MRLLALLLFASTLAAQAPPLKQYPHDQVKLSQGQHLNPETTEPYNWTESIDAPAQHFWYGMSDRFGIWDGKSKVYLWRITFPPGLVSRTACLGFDLDAPKEKSGPYKGQSVGQIYQQEADNLGVTLKVHQGHHIEEHCTSVRERSQLGVMIARPQDVGLMKCPANTERKTRPNENPALVEVVCVPLKP